MGCDLHGEAVTNISQQGGCHSTGVRIRGDIDPLTKVPFIRESEVGLRRVPFKGSPYYYPVTTSEARLGGLNPRHSSAGARKLPEKEGAPKNCDLAAAKAILNPKP